MRTVNEDKVARQVVRELAAVGGLGPGRGERLVLDFSDLHDVGVGHGPNLIASNYDHVRTAPVPLCSGLASTMAPRTVKSSPIYTCRSANCRAESVSSSPFRSLDDGVCLDFDQHLGRGKAAYLDQRRGRPNLTECLAVGTRGIVLRGDVDQVDAGSYDVIEGGPGLGQSGLDVANALRCLFVDTAGHDLAVVAPSDSPRHEDAAADTHGPAEANNGLEGRVRRDVLAHQRAPKAAGVGCQSRPSAGRYAGARRRGGWHDGPAACARGSRAAADRVRTRP